MAELGGVHQRTLGQCPIKRPTKVRKRCHGGLRFRCCCARGDFGRPFTPDGHTRAKILSVAETCFDVLSRLFAADIDQDLLRQAAAKTPTERITWLEEMQAFAEDAEKARKHAAARSANPAR